MALETVKVYDAKNNRELNVKDLEKFLCCVCKCILEEPVQIIHCGYRCCRSCAKPKSDVALTVCPADNEQLGERVEVRDDKGCLREMNGLNAVCATCGHSGPLSASKAHQLQCLMSCVYCHAKMKRNEMAVHLDEVCTEYMMSCPWKQNGCTFENKRLSMTEHIIKNHSIQQLELLVQLQTQVNLVCEKMRKVQPALENELTQLEPVLPSSTSATQAGPGPESQLVGCSNKCNDDLSSKRIEVSVLESVDLKFKALKDDQLSKLESKVDTLNAILQRHESELKDLSLKYEILQVKTTNGVFIWKVTSISHRYSEARDGTTYSIFSPPFFTSPHGYRMCLRMYLNGDGDGKGTHISLFLVLMKGEHDSILPWPFSHKVTLSLINQKNPNLSKMECFLPDKTSSSFQKPQHDFNVAIGFPKFVPQSFINDSGFCQDDCFFVKAKVDISGTNQD